MATFFSALRLALSAIVRSKLRTALTMLGILIGVAAVVVTTALGAGARARISDQIERLGSNTLLVFPQANQASGAKGAQGAQAARLTEDDVRALLRGGTSIGGAAPFVRTSAQLVYEDKNASTQIFGTTRAYFPVRGWQTKAGELWTEASDLTGERVCLLGTTVAEALFGPFDPVGRVVRIGRYPFRVVGVLESKGQSPFGTDQDDTVLMPVSTFRSHVLWMPRKNVHGILLSATSAETSDHAKMQAEAILRERHRIGAGRDDDFVIRTQAEFRASQDAIYGTLSMLLLVVGCVSLLVGGIGIMNIMLVSVVERTREIGIRMAVGAREHNIMLEFLVESVLLALFGGALGAAVAGGVVAVIERWFEWPMRLEPRALVIALLTSSGIGIAFGFFPARRAARLDPIQALHRE
ncbi:MAG TPA: ABC transporter permease [Polyangiaceae bacterium]|nr:ABC transporter permease [Polyangiaceae bacterium]